MSSIGAPCGTMLEPLYFILKSANLSKGTLTKVEENIMQVVKEAAVEYFMPLVILWRYLTAPESAKTISIEHPKCCVRK